jgi:hypothetical protein
MHPTLYREFYPIYLKEGSPKREVRRGGRGRSEEGEEGGKGGKGGNPGCFTRRFNFPFIVFPKPLSVSQEFFLLSAFFVAILV